MVAVSARSTCCVVGGPYAGGQSRCCTATLGQSSPVGLTVAGLPRVLRFGDATGGQAAMRALPDIACGRRGRRLGDTIGRNAVR